MVCKVSQRRIEIHHHDFSPRQSTRHSCSKTNTSKVFWTLLNELETQESETERITVFRVREFVVVVVVVVKEEEEEEDDEEEEEEVMVVISGVVCVFLFSTNLSKSYQELRYEKRSAKHDHKVDRVAFVRVFPNAFTLGRKPAVHHSPNTLDKILLRQHAW
jgi:hypothetical protein